MKRLKDCEETLVEHKGCADMDLLREVAIEWIKELGKDRDIDWEIDGLKGEDTPYESCDSGAMTRFIKYFFGQLPFTSIKQRKMNFFRQLILLFNSIILQSKPIRYFDRKVFPYIANSLQQGSYITVIAKKIVSPKNNN